MNETVLVSLRSVAVASCILGLSACVSSDWVYPPPAGYPPRWNVRRENLPEEMCVFRPGIWGDTKRYWADQALSWSSPSRPLADMRIIYQMKIGSDRYEEIKPAVARPDDR